MQRKQNNDPDPNPLVNTVPPRAGSLWERWRWACLQVWGSSTAAWRCRYLEDSHQVYTTSQPQHPLCGESADKDKHKHNDWCDLNMLQEFKNRHFLNLKHPFILPKLHGKMWRGAPGSHWDPAMAPVHEWTFPTEWLRTSRCQMHERRSETSVTLEHTWRHAMTRMGQ